MGNRLSKIYTRTGDDGSTGLGDGTRVSKDSARVTAYGTVDEANSAIGQSRQVVDQPFVWYLGVTGRRHDADRSDAGRHGDQRQTAEARREPRMQHVRI